MVTVIIRWLLLILLALLALVITGLEQPVFLVIGHGVFGWLGFLFRVIPVIQWNPMAIATGLVCVAFLLVGTHSFLVWLSRSWQAGQAEATPWRKSWTVSLVSLVVLAFVAGTAVIGVTHQIAWLSTSPDPWIKSERWQHPSSLVYKFSSQIEEARKTHRDLDSQTLRLMHQEAGERFRVAIIKDQAGQPWLVAVGPREVNDPRWQEGAFMSVTETAEGVQREFGRFPVDKWAALIAKAQSGQPMGGTKF